MITGKNSLWKMLALFLIVLLAALNVIFCKTTAVGVLNVLVTSAELLAVCVILYLKWSAEN